MTDSCRRSNTAIRSDVELSIELSIDIVGDSVLEVQGNAVKAYRPDFGFEDIVFEKTSV